jgi:hypothetical protein
VGRLHTLDQAFEAGEAGRQNELEVSGNTAGRKHSNAVADVEPSRRAP